MNICFFAKERLQKIIFMNIKYFLYVLFFNQLHVLLAFLGLQLQPAAPSPTTTRSGHNNVARRCSAVLLGSRCGLVSLPKGCRRCLRAYSRRDLCGRFGNEKEAKCRPRVSRGTVGERCGLGTSPRVPKVPPSLFKTGSMRMFRQRKSGKVLPKGVARLCWGTLRGFNVAQGYRAELLGNVLGL